MLMRDAVLDEIGGEYRADEILQAAEQKLTYQRKFTDERTRIMDSLKGYFNRHKLVQAAWVFGSFARNEMTPESDIDVMVRFDNDQVVTLMDLGEIMGALEKLTGRRIDLVEEGQLAPYALKTAAHYLIKIHG
jgi:predicted nucleotidyltransferase